MPDSKDPLNDAEKAFANVKFREDDMQQTNGQDQDTWPEPDLSFMDAGHHDVPALPHHDAFPPATARWIELAAKASGAPLDYVALSLLGVVAGVCGGGVIVQATPAWSEPLVFWLAPVGDPSTGKTPGIAVGRDLLQTIQDEHQANDGKRRREHATREAQAKAAHQKWLSEVEDAVNAGLSPPLQPDDLEIPAAFVPTQFLVGDATLESIFDVISGNPRGIISWRDELAAWFSSFQRYSNGTYRPTWLEGWSAGRASINRKSRREPLFLKRCPLSVLGSIQPDRLREVLAGADDGLAARFLYALPDRPPFRRLIDQHRPPTAEMLDLLRRIASGAGAADNPLVLTLTKDALGDFDAFRRDHHYGAVDYAGLGSSWYLKGPGQVLRLAGALHMLTESERTSGRCKDCIPASTICRAVRLWKDYFLPHAMAAFAVGGASESDHRLRRIVDWVRRKSIGKFTQRQIYRQVFWGALRPNDVAALLKQLGEEFHVIRPVPRPARPGRRSSQWEVNPHLMGNQHA
jgi:hypothetical protein